MNPAEIRVISCFIECLSIGMRCAKGCVCTGACVVVDGGSYWETAELPV